MHADGILLDDTVWGFFFFLFFFSPEHRMCVYVGGGAGVCVCVGGNYPFLCIIAF